MTDVLSPTNGQQLEQAADGRFFNTPTPDVAHVAQEAVSLDQLAAVSQAARTVLNQMTPEDWAVHRENVSALVNGRGDSVIKREVGRIETLLADAGRYYDALSVVRRAGEYSVRNF